MSSNPPGSVPVPPPSPLRRSCSFSSTPASRRRCWHRAMQPRLPLCSHLVSSQLGFAPSPLRLPLPSHLAPSPHRRSSGGSLTPPRLRHRRIPVVSSRPGPSVHPASRRGRQPASPLQCPRRRHVGIDESSTPRSSSAVPAATTDLSHIAKQQQTFPRHPEPARPRQIERPRGYSI